MLTKIRERTQGAMLREELLCEEADSRTLAEAIAGAIFVSQGKRLHYVNHAAATITGYTREELLSMNFWDLVHSDSRELVGDRERRHQRQIVVRTQQEVKILAKGGEERWLDIRTGIIEFDGVLSSLVSGFDVTDRKKAQEQLQLLTVTDPLTGLGNYRRLVETLDAEISRCGRTGRSFAVLLLDLDQLKKINDQWGHLIGSQALCRLADVVRVHCRAIDTATRYGGDEFAVVLPETNAAAARLVASRIRIRLSTDGLQPPISASIGVAVFPRDGETIEALLRAADRELYQMKTGAGEEPAPLICNLVSSSVWPGSEEGISKKGRARKAVAGK